MLGPWTPNRRNPAQPIVEGASQPSLGLRPGVAAGRDAAPRTVRPERVSIAKGLGMVALMGHGVVLGGGLAGAAMMAGSRIVSPGNRAKSGPLKVSSRVIP